MICDMHEEPSVLDVPSSQNVDYAYGCGVSLIADRFSGILLWKFVLGRSQTLKEAKHLYVVVGIQYCSTNVPPGSVKYDFHNKLRKIICCHCDL